jgi:hypothetical protein
MSLLPATALTRIRALVAETMGDTCQRLQRTAVGTDSHGRPQYSYQPVGEVLPCGVKPASGYGAGVDSEGGVVVADYTLRLPYGAQLGNHDRIRILGRHGETLVQPLDADIIGAVEHGLTAVSVKLKVIFYG